ncbi:MAG: signal peptide peptidase SppA [Candidatus Micrarchaeia archaeon]
MKVKNLLIGITVFLLVIVIVAIGLVLVIPVAAPSPCVGVIEVDGQITLKKQSYGLFETQGISAEEIEEMIGEAEMRDDIKAVVFEINSPGGSVVATREMYENVKSLKKPKVAYLREIAASGGYYVAVGTDYIVTDPDAITGSIGVRATFEDLSGLFEKLGINVTTIKSGEKKDIGDPTRPLSEEERAILQGIVDEIFLEFREDVRESRGSRLNSTAFAEVLDGRILTGRQAKRVGLVDEVGNKKTAIRVAGRMAGIEGEPRVCKIERRVGLWESMLSGLARVLPLENSQRINLYFS